MLSRLPVSVVTVLMTLVVGNAPMASSAEPGRLAAFAARQDLCDEVSVAMADGRIDRAERYIILSDAKGILKSDEYESFKRSLNRVSPPTPVTKRSAKPKKPATVAQEKPPSPPTPSLATTILAEAEANQPEETLPDRVASTDAAR